MVAATLVGVTVATQSAASASTFGPDPFMDFAGVPSGTPAATVQYDGTGEAGWANGPNTSPTTYGTCTAANADAAHVGGIHAPGTNGLFDCGNKIPSFPPTAAQVPQFHNQGTGIFDQAFVPTPTNSDNVAGCGTGSYTFSQSNAKFNQDFSQMNFSVAGSEPKGQISNVYAVARQTSNTAHNDEIYVGLERPVVNGDEHTDFQFLQEPVSLGSNCGPNFVSSAREAGDFVLEINFTNGGNLANPNVYVWSCTGSLPIPATGANKVGTACSNSTNSSANWVPLPACTGSSTGPGCYPASSILIDANQSSAIDCGGWVCGPNHNTSTSTSIPADGFMEAALNLDALGVNTGCASTFLALTRSSQSFTSQMKHFSPPHTFDTCSPTQTVTTPENASNAAIGTGTPPGITLGSPAHDVAVVTPTGIGVPASTPPTGTVNFFECGPLPTAAGCTASDPTRHPVTTAPPTGGTAGTPTANATTFTSSNFTAPSTGIFCFEGDFVPSGKFEPSSDTSGTECFQVNPLKPPFTTSITSPATTTVGNSWNDAATLVGTSPYGPPTGSVSFAVCKETVPSSPCTSGGTSVGTVSTPVVGVDGVTATYTLPALDAYTPKSVGTYCYLASYTATASGNYSSVPAETGTECFTVTPAPSLTNTVATGHAVAGGFGTVTDTVTVTGNSAGGDPTGSVAFYFCKASSSANTPGVCPATPTSLDTETLSAGTDPNTGVASTTTTFIPTAAGTWCFGAVYTPAAGSNYLGSADNTVSGAGGNADPLECVTIASLTPTVATTVVDESSPSNVTGAIYHDTATVTGTPGTLPTGTLTYVLYGTTDCTGTPIQTSTVTLDSGGNVPKSASTTALGAGSYCYLATYNGDGNYNSAPAAKEPFTINKSPTTISTTVFDVVTGQAWDLVNGQLAPGSAYDTYGYTSGVVNGFTPGGTVTYKLYSGVTGTNCAGGTLLSTDTEPAGTNSLTTSGLAAGSYGYLATYSGDSNYVGSSATCEPFEVVTPILTASKTATPSPVTTPGTGIVPIGQVITYTINLTNIGDAPATNVAVTDGIPTGTTVVLGSASGSSGSGTLTATGVSWTIPSIAANGGTASVSFRVTVSSGDFNGEHIDNFAVFTNEGTPNCSTTTCDTNTVEHIVGLPIVDVVKIEPTPGDGSTVTAGQSAPITYELAVTNSGLLPATNVVVKDVIPAGSTYVAGSASSGGSFTSNTVSWTVATVGPESNNVPGEVDLTFQVTVNAADADGSNITNQASFSDINTVGCVAAPATGFCLTNTVSNPVVAPIVDASKSSSPPDGSTVAAGSNVTYTISLTNTGHADATETVTDTVPVGTTFVSASGGVTPNGSGLITWSNISVPAGTTSGSPVTVSFVVTVNASDANGLVIPNHALFTNNHTPTCNTSDGDTNATTCDTNTVTLTVIKPIVAVVKSDVPGDEVSVIAGQAAPITYTLAVTNSGSEDATNVVVTDVIPAGSTYVAGSVSNGGNYDSTSNSLTWTITVPKATPGPAGSTPGEVDLTFKVSVNASDLNGSEIDNQASFSNVNTADCTPGTTVNTCLTNIVDNPVLAPIVSASKSSNPVDGSTVPAGSNVTYTISLINSGGAAATETVTDTVPAGTTFVSASGGVTPNGSGLITWSNVNVPAGTTSESPVTVSFTVTVNLADANGLSIPNHALFTNSNTPTCNTSDADTTSTTCDTNTVTVTVVKPIINVVKSEPTPGDTVSVVAGVATITYNLTVSNVGGQAASNVAVSDVIPTGATYVPGSADASGGTYSSGDKTVTWDVPTVPAAADATHPGTAGPLSFQVAVDASDANGSTIVNQAAFSDINTVNCNPGTAEGTCLTNTVSNPVIKPIVSSSKSSDPANGSTVTPGSSVTYTIALTNAGGAPGTETVTDTVPAGTTFVSASGGVIPDNTGLITWNDVSVPAGTTTESPVTVSFTVTVNSSDANGFTIPNHAIYINENTPECITSSDTNPATAAAIIPTTCDTNTVTLTVIKPIINVVKSEPTPGDGKTVTAGQSAPITYNLSVTNAGSLAATDLTVTDVIPAGSTYVASSANLGGTFDSTTNTVTWLLATVPAATDATHPGTAGPLTFQVTVNSSDANGSTITNQAAFSDINTVTCKAGTTEGTCLTNQVSNPVVVLTPTPGTAPLVTTTVPVVHQALPFTGANAKAMAIFAVTLVGSGLVLVLLGRRRRRDNG